jgi:dihydrofolate reductase
MAKIHLIAACSKDNRIIGNKGEIPWKINGEQKKFKEMTTGNIVVMGRKTHEDIGRLLPNRTNVVLTRNKEYIPKDKDVLAFCYKYDFLSMFRDIGDEIIIFVIGGEQIYKEFLPICDYATVSYVDGSYEGDAFLPEFEKDFDIISEERIESNINYTIKKMKRKEIPND